MGMREWSFLLDEALLIYISVFLFFKGIMLRRRTEVGAALARNNFAMAVAYLSALLGLHFSFFSWEVWRWAVRLVVAITLTHAAWLMLKYLEGWRGVRNEVWYMFREFGTSWKAQGCRICHWIKGCWIAMRDWMRPPREEQHREDIGSTWD